MTRDNVITKILYAALFIFAACFIVLGVRYIISQYPIQEIVVRGNVPSDVISDLKELISKEASTDIFSVDVRDIQYKILQYSWISNVNIRRVWPNKLIVDIAIQKPVAYWGNSQLISSYGEIFDPPKAWSQLDNLPVFIGQEDNAINMLDVYYQAETMLLPLNINIKKILLDDNGDWQMLLNNGIIIKLGQTDFVIDRLNRFVSLYNNLFKSNVKRVLPKMVDLRYAHGIAVQE